MEKQTRFDEAAAQLGEPLCHMLGTVSAEVKEIAQEIRLRSDRPLVIHTGRMNLFVREDGVATNKPSPDSIVTSSVHIEAAFRRLCRDSVHTHAHEIREGFISLPGGHRAGVCGRVVCGADGVVSLRDISSINVRIARQVFGAGDELMHILGCCQKGKGILVAGAPSSGKTTMIRDLARQLSTGDIDGQIRKVLVVDERGELGASYDGVPQNDLGFCDVLDGCPKRDGILWAVRSMSPEYIICDEIGTEDEAQAVEASMNAGVGIIATIHAGHMKELYSRPQARRLLNTGAFAKIVLLQGVGKPCMIAKVENVGEEDAQTGGRIIADHDGLGRWNAFFCQVGEEVL